MIHCKLSLQQIAALIFCLAAISIGCNPVSTDSPDAPINLESNNDSDASIIDLSWDGEIYELEQKIARGADIETRKPDGTTALIAASVMGKVEAVSILLKAGANINAQKEDGSTALHASAFLCEEEIVKILLESGADRTIKNSAGATALDSVESPFEDVKVAYDILQSALGPYGLTIDYDDIQEKRPVIAKMLSDQ